MTDTPLVTTTEEANIVMLWEALDRAAWAIFQMKRMHPDAVREFASDAHAAASQVLDKFPFHCVCGEQI